MMRGARFPTFVATLLVGRLASAQSVVDRQACVDAYEGAQVASKHDQFSRAREQIRVCLSAACPGVLRAECAQWLDGLERRQPSVVLECQGPDGTPATTVDVRLDGVLLTRTLQGKALDIDPGPHELVFELPSEPPLALRVVVREGEKRQRFSASFPLRRGSPPGASVDVARRPVPWTVYALSGLGVAAAGAFVGIGLWGNAGKNDLEACRPDCTSSATSGVRGRYIAADVMLGVSLVSLGVAAVLYFTRGSVPRPVARVDPAPRL